MASQVLFGRPHRRDGMRRLTLRFRELIDVVLQSVELAPEAIDFLVLPCAVRFARRRGRRLQLQPQSPIRSRPSQRERADDARAKRYCDQR